MAYLLLGGQELDLVFLASVLSGSCAKILLWWRAGNSGSGSGLLLIGMLEGLMAGLLESSRRSPDSVLDLLLLLCFLLTLLELLEDLDFLLLLSRRLDLRDFLLCVLDEDLRSEPESCLLTAETLCCLSPEALGKGLATVPEGAAAAELAVAAFSSDGGPGGMV